MALETPVNHIADLVVTNPAAGDAKQQGDDHIRNIKTALKADLVGFSGAITVSGADSGAANTVTLTPSPALGAYGTRMTAVFGVAATNTGATTINISGLGAKALVSVSGAALVAGDLVAGCTCVAVYDGTQFQLTATTKRYMDALAFGALPDLYLHVRDQKASNTQGGASISGYNVRTLNTVVGTNSIPGASLAGNIVTLPAGTYEFDAVAPCVGGTSHKLTLYNDSDSTDIQVGMSSSTSTAVLDSSFNAVCKGRFTLAATKNVKLHHYIFTAGTYGLGIANALGTVEVYASLQLRKIA